MASEHPNRVVAQALAPIRPSLATKVLSCWEPPFRQPCRRYLFCRACARYRQRRLAAVYERRLAAIPSPFFLTLTVPSSRILTRRLINSFRGQLASLRRWRRWRRAVRGGFYAIEIKLGDSGNWSVHAHVLLDLADTALSKNEITRAWHRRTGGFEVDFQPVEAGTLATVFGYITKAQKVAVRVTVGAAVSSLTQSQVVCLDPDHLRDFVAATTSFRPSMSFGSFHHQYGKLPTNRRGGLVSRDRTGSR